MPYIPPEERPQYEGAIEELLRYDALTEPGHLNYVIFATVRRYIHKHGLSYKEIRNLRAELRECHDEIKRRLLDEHEDSKILENGDVE